MIFAKIMNVSICCYKIGIHAEFKESKTDFVFIVVVK